MELHVDIEKNGKDIRPLMSRERSYSAGRIGRRYPRTYLILSFLTSVACLLMLALFDKSSVNGTFEKQNGKKSSRGNDPVGPSACASTL